MNFPYLPIDALFNIPSKQRNLRSRSRSCERTYKKSTNSLWFTILILVLTHTIEKFPALLELWETREAIVYRSWPPHKSYYFGRPIFHFQIFNGHGCQHFCPVWVTFSKCYHERRPRPFRCKWNTNIYLWHENS